MSVVAVEDGGSREAFLADAQRFRRELLAHCYRMTGSLHDAEDLVQETFLKLFRNVQSYQPTDRFAAYHRGMLDHGIYLPCSQFEANFVSTAHTDQDLDDTIAAAGKVLAEIA